MIKKLLNFINQQTTFGEIIRFLFVGGLATVIDFLAMAITLYILEPASTYPHFYNIFFGGGEPSVLNNVFGTGTGFLFGLLANYVLSICFVFNEKGNSKTKSGFVKFAVLSAIGLGIHVGGMALFNGVLKIDEWIVKIVLTLVVLVYNYVTRRLLIFKKDNNQLQTETGENQ